ncbi:MAG: hypothetical protein JXQ71_18110 [Verrucomicrobia bacterium]|nr:hypothetical protein [Verrucomicrobiota bacterium]
MNPITLTCARRRRDVRAADARWPAGSPARAPGRAWLCQLVCILVPLLGTPEVLSAADEYLNTRYDNYWFTNPPTGLFTNYFGAHLTNASTAVFGGHVLGNTNDTLPQGGGFGLEWSAIGQPVEGIQADVAFGDVILPPTGALTNQPPANFAAVAWEDNTNAYYQCTNPVGGAIWIPATGEIIATQPNNIMIDWRMEGGEILHQLINVSAVPSRRPARLFWTEKPYDAPKVSLNGLFPIVHYNSAVTRPVYEVTATTNGTVVTYTSNLLYGVWIDDEKLLHAKNVSGLFIITYYQEGNYRELVQPQGMEIVQVMEPDLQLIRANVGSRLMPNDTYWAEMDGINGLLPDVTVGINDTAYVHSQTGPKDNWVFAIKRTAAMPWALEIYWQHKGSMGVLWPYEVDWYSCDWPPYPQRYVVGDAAPYDTAPVLIPAELSAELMEDQDPRLHASLSASGRSFSTTEPGTCLLKYTTHDNIWFEVVRTLSHTDEAYFDLEPREWPIGEELSPGDPQAHALRFDGADDYVDISENYLNRKAEWTISFWFNPAKIGYAALYSEGNPAVTLSVELTWDGRLQVNTFNQDLYLQGHPGWTTATTPNAPVRVNQWQHLAVTFKNGSDTNGTVQIFLDDFAWETNNMHWVTASGPPKSVIGGKWISGRATAFFQGKIDAVHVWNAALTPEQIRTNRYVVWPETRDSLVASFPCNEGQGDILHNQAGNSDGSAMGGPVWCYGQFVPVEKFWAEFPGYIHVAEGNLYNVNRYHYPTEATPNSESHVFGVNAGVLEVWWANRSRFPDMPAVYYPSRVVRYTNVWPAAPPQLVIASGLGSSGNSLLDTDEALAFNGTSGNYARVPNTTLFNVGDQLTVEAWVKLSDPGPDQKIVFRVNNSTGTNGGFYLGVAGGMLQAVDYPDYAGPGFWLLQQDPVPTNVWTHICFTRGNSVMATYTNGQPASQLAIWLNPIRNCTADLSIGCSTWGDNDPTLGSIGEVRIWNKARSREEIAATWRTRLNGDEAGLVAYYPFTRGADSSVLTDAGPFLLDGTITGATWAVPGHPVCVPGPLVLGAPSIYSQNDPNLPGYNPNEEHALVMSGVAYALRNDLNRWFDGTRTQTWSEPFVLVDYLDPNTARPAMLVCSVLATNELYTFDRDLTAGLPIQPIMPLAAMPLCKSNFSTNTPPAWSDRKLGWWAVSAGDDGGPADARMFFYYQMQPTFYFPALSAHSQPDLGSEIPWLPGPDDPAYAHGTGGWPVPVTYHITWPADVPELKRGQTLTLATHGLPEIWNQLSVDVTYDQSARTKELESVTLFDPLVACGTNLDSTVVQAMVDSKLARQDLTSPLIRFPDLPPSLYPRIYYDPNRGYGGQLGQLVLEGQYVSTLTGDGYLLLNLLEDFEKDQVKELASALDASKKGLWDAAVDKLPSELTLITSSNAYVKAALAARLTNGIGYVTVAFNNSTNRLQVPQALPVSVSVIKVVPELHSAPLQVILPDDALAEQLSVRYSGDLAGKVEEAEFQWRWIEPFGGLVPNTNYLTDWKMYVGADFTVGLNEITITGASDFTLSDHYFAVRYRPTDPADPTRTNWSAWTHQLAPGWVKRAMTGVNPFEQIFHDMTANTVDTRVSMISQAGGPYEGDVALNLNAASSAGLIATYQTIFNRAKAFSIAADIDDDNINQTLLFAASRLHDLYMLLGNEAYADAQDPTIAFPRSLTEDQHGGEATSIFPFMNQVPNLLEEELALLRGRDGTLEPSVRTSPIYNRLIWNYTQGLNGGEPAYAYNYNIRGVPTNTDGLITVDDAKRFYPQGHGDAWGHYLSAISPYYDLLSNTNFGWHTLAEATLLGGSATVSADYLDEQKFAETAAARARTGAQIVRQTFRQCYSEDPTGRWPGYTDSDPDRAWGVGEWGSRAGQAALYDWAVANSLMLDRLTNMAQVRGADRPPEGIEKIDRASTPELSEITSAFKDIQTQIDSANAGLNPLGLARNVVPFDIDPAAIDAGQTHFEQIYSRALQALYNACVAFDHARNATLRLREQSDSTYDLEEALAANETDYHNRLLQLYGYPYPDDVGPGKTYPQGYDGPDLVNWRILDLENLLVNAPTGQVMEVVMYNLEFTPGNDFEGHEYEDYIDLPHTVVSYPTNLVTNSVCMAENGLQVKPSTWTSRRPAQGELQLALSDYVQTWYALEAKMADYDQTLAELEVDIEHRRADYERYPEEWEEHEANVKDKKATAQLVSNLKMAKEAMELLAESVKEGGELIADLLPHIHSGFYFPIAPGMVAEVDTSPISRAAVAVTYYASMWAAHGLEMGAAGREASQEEWDADLEELLKGNEYQAVLRWCTAETLVKLKEQYVKQAELFAQIEALSQSYERVQKLLAEGRRLIFERGQVRSRAAQRLQSQRYADLSFRIFRDDALRRYQSTFDLAARYTYLAAKAYDYETGLLSSDTARTPGSRFLEDVVRARLPGRFYVWLGTPMAGGGSGEPGLADILARMKADWDVVKGRYGFNNPDTETSRFSLRTELFRISPSTNSDPTWEDALESCRVANLHEVPEFVRYCRPYIDTTNIEPGLVIPFSTFVVAGQNYFGRDLAGGDNAYDASRAATKIRSAGVWFTGYNTTFNTNSTGPGLANEPRVYLIPVGQDVMRSPTRNAVQTRSWTVFDQAIPLPYSVGGAAVDAPDWIPVIDSLREPLAQIRHYASLRAYHDSGEFDESEALSNSRLVGRSVWNSRWLLIIPGRTLLSDPDEGIERFIHGATVNDSPDGNGIKDIKIFFQTYSISGD